MGISVRKHLSLLSRIKVLCAEPKYISISSDTRLTFRMHFSLVTAKFLRVRSALYLFFTLEELEERPVSIPQIPEDFSSRE